MKTRTKNSHKGLSLVEILIAGAMLTGLFIPVLHLTTRNVGQTRRDSVRLVCETLCRTVLEVFGRVELESLTVFAHTDDPNVYQAVDVWNRQDILKPLVMTEEIVALIRAYDIRTVVTVTKNVSPGLHRITSDISWFETRGGKKVRSVLRDSRLYAGSQMLPP